MNLKRKILGISLAVWLMIGAAIAAIDYSYTNAAFEMHNPYNPG